MPTKEIIPKTKPKPVLTKEMTEIKKDIDISIKIKEKPKPNFDIASMLKDLRKEKENIQRPLRKEGEKDEKNLEEISKQNESSVLSITEIQLLTNQLRSCWSAPAGAVIKKGMIVKISAKIKPNKEVLYDTVRILDTNIPQSNPFYGPITESAMRTLLNPECNPLKLPENKYELWKNLTINFDHGLMKGYQ